MFSYVFVRCLFSKIMTRDILNVFKRAITIIYVDLYLELLHLGAQLPVLFGRLYFHVFLGQGYAFLFSFHFLSDETA
jgi:hypothetical protein